MTLAELISEVVSITKRPDKTTEISSAIKNATLKAHQKDYFWKDLKEEVVDFNSAAYIQQLDYRAVFPKFRAAKYLRKYDPTTNTPGKLLTKVVPENVFDAYQIQKQDIFYAAGAFINLNSSTQERYYQFGCYLNPDITDSGYNSWIALDHPYCIIYDAAATIFKAIGKDEEAAQYRVLCLELYSELISSNLDPVGY